MLFVWFFKINLYLFLAVLVLVASWAFSLVTASRDYSLVAVRGLLIAVAPLAAGSPGSGAQAQQLWQMSLVFPWHVGSSQTRDGTHVSCFGR